ncbi:hypothetical protein PB2503_07187 [Parvularcula bermudensis HTCC2503]|uniref:Uncharacterized protein n=1 Tax=Parvularcula bermudensis (strain ATCC BAA-594 / HTCC2503 / KCTC 12087) TaxID=314260 RepID=E0TEC8_PARBH|nr:hypothetical protein [Parvularcula bermudensis]ADM09503.1 hypothetical protein PB2503_07187 [Parvularcula bermudensis HTCC2503]
MTELTKPKPRRTNAQRDAAREAADAAVLREVRDAAQVRSDRSAILREARLQQEKDQSV